MALSFLSLQQACDNLLTCVCAELDRLPAEAGLAGCPCRACVVPGTPAVDGCDGGCDVAPGEYPGQLTVSVARAFTATRASFPAEISIVRDLSLCADPGFLAADLMVQVWRCAPGPSDDGCPPPCDALTESATQLHADMLAVQRAVTCCFSATNTDRRKGWRYRVGVSTPLGPQGGCVGFQALVSVALEGALAPVQGG